MLKCGHNICSISLKHLYHEETKNIICPLCKTISSYENKEDITNNIKVM